MKSLLSLRRFRGIAVLAIALLAAPGCFDSGSSLGPDQAPTDGSDAAQAPVLPSADNLTFQLGFFQDNEEVALQRAGKWNFYNAFVRVVAVSAFTELVLAPPIGAFALALHTVPSPQPDGSWMWVYTWVDGAEEVQIRLSGTIVSDDRADWELRVSSTVEGWDKVLWFEGETWSDGDGGDWMFHDLDDAANPAVATLEWGADTDGEYLRLSDIVNNIGDSLEYRGDGTISTVTYTDASDADLSWYVNWHELDGSGNLRAPDYNEGEKACWDEHQNDVECPVVPAS